MEFVWGFQSKVVGYSKTSPSFHYPPPTTMLGALAASIAKENNLSESRIRDLMPALSNDLLAIGVKSLNCLPIKFSDINKLIATKITGGIRYPTPADPYGSFDAPATGKTILTSLNDEPPRLRFYLVFEDNTIRTSDARELVLDKHVMWSIHRLGSKESLVSVTNVEEFKTEKLTGKIHTSYSFPLIRGVTAINYVSPKWTQEVLINPFTISIYDPVTHYLLGQNTVKYVIPIVESLKTLPTYLVEVTDDACAYKYGEEVVVGVCRKM
ncbi:MAG: type I-A CRISPR-associated protein Cas5a [Aigarchaeota archaeon]|nr:type I-A CRISPR-associated protein Cas5a [Aigarchaeota archaeon]